MRYIIGIDLGTTNSCVAYVDSEDPKASVQSFKIQQLTSAGCVEALPTLPSFCYLCAFHEWPKGAISLPWNAQNDFFVGRFAQQQGTKVPTRLVQSAKSWLCHAAASRRDKILPLEAAEDNSRISPIEATARYLGHIKEAWNETMAKGNIEAEFENQEVILTVPASFDEVARTLTVEAARIAGFSKMTLLEEPQAAFYSWIAQHEDSWASQMPVGSRIVVCDVGGGTTDFSLIEVVSKDGVPTFQRMAVGNHLLLGGDNMDAAIDHLIESKLEEKGVELNSLQRMQILQEARHAKEVLLKTAKKGEGEQGTYRVLLQGSGSSVVQGTVAIELNKQEVQKLLLEGFFGQYAWQDALQVRKAAGFRTMGLPYEDEPSITKHLANFLKSCSTPEGSPLKPDFILFNGGAMKPNLFQEAIVESLRRWFPEKVVKTLPSYHLDLAVARGAAYYGKARRGLGVRIGGGLARGYYLVLNIKEQDGNLVQKALTLLPRGSEEGDTFEPKNSFFLTPNTPVSFQLCTSHVRLHDLSGDLIDIDPLEMQFLPPIHTILRFGRRQAIDASQEKIPVHIQIKLTPIGTLEINLLAQKTTHQWNLEFQLKTASGQENSISALNQREADQTFQAGYLEEAETIIRDIFSTEKQRTLKTEQLMEKLEKVLAMPRKDWPPSILRGLSDIVMKLAPQRKISSDFAVRWWNLMGFLLRPGFGYPLDDFRIKELWKIILNDFKISQPQDVHIQTWICYRRVAGGMSKGQQMHVAAEIIASLISKKSERIEIKGKAELYAYSEKIRAVAAMELIETPLKLRLGEALLWRICQEEASSADYWALGRLGARHLIYGSLANVVPSAYCEQWIRRLLKLPKEKDSQLALLVGQLARKTEHREINLSKECISEIIDRFASSPHVERLQQLLLTENRLTQSEQEQAFGDKLPAGLLLEV